MDSLLRATFPKALQALVDEIEYSAGCEIQFRRVDDIGRACGDGRKSEMCALLDQIEASGVAAIRLVVLHRVDLDHVDNRFPVPYAMLCHELLHFRRYVVEGVPALLDEHDIEMMLEHLVINRQLRYYGFDFPLHFSDRASWEDAAQRARSARAGRPRPQSSEVVKGAMRAYVSSRFLLDDDPGLRQLAAEVMSWYGLLDSGVRLADALMPYIGTPGLDPVLAKWGMLDVVCDQFGLPHGSVKMRRFVDGRLIPCGFILHPSTNLETI